jgi:hypothetical protein
MTPAGFEPKISADQRPLSGGYQEHIKKKMFADHVMNNACKAFIFQE